MIKSVTYKIDLDFEGVYLEVEYIDWESQPNREKYLGVRVYDGVGGKMKTDSAPYKFIVKRFKESDEFKEIVDRFNIK